MADETDSLDSYMAELGRESDLLPPSVAAATDGTDVAHPPPKPPAARRAAVVQSRRLEWCALAENAAYFSLDAMIDRAPSLARHYGYNARESGRHPLSSMLLGARPPIDVEADGGGADDDGEESEASAAPSSGDDSGSDGDGFDGYDDGNNFDAAELGAGADGCLTSLMSGRPPAEQHLLRAMCARFVRGRDADFDYRAVDGDDTLVSGDAQRDAEDRWFDSATGEDACAAGPNTDALTTEVR